MARTTEIAYPSAAPPDIPVIKGSARGFLKKD
jgi:hypothetical protein